MKKRYRTDYLFSTSSFLSGMGTVINLAGNYYNFNSYRTESEADAIAIGNDFKMIGQDIYDALENLKNK